MDGFRWKIHLTIANREINYNSKCDYLCYQLTDVSKKHFAFLKDS